MSVEHENWEYESKRNGWRFFLSIPDVLEPWDVRFIEGIFDEALDQCRRRLQRVTKFDGYEVDHHETTDQIVRKLKTAQARPTKCASEIMSLQTALILHCA